MGASPLADRRAEGAQHSGALIAGAEEEREQAISRGVDEQNALATGGQRAAQRGYEAGFAHAAGKREDGHHRRRAATGAGAACAGGAVPSRTPRSANQRVARRSRDPCNVSSGAGGRFGWTRRLGSLGREPRGPAGIFRSIGGPGIAVRREIFFAHGRVRSLARRPV